MSLKVSNLLNKKTVYDPKAIQKLDPREHIRFRPGMYVGGTGLRALHHLVYEVLDNSVESAFVGKCDTITLRILPDNKISITDNDQLFPEKLHQSTWDEKHNKHALDVFMTEIGAGNKFDNETYRVTGGLHGVGISAICALSSSTEVIVHYDNTVWKRSYREGLPIGAIQQYQSPVDVTDGFTMTFQPDFSIMDEGEFDYDRLAKRCSQVAYNTPNLTVTLIDERVEPHREEIFHKPDGLKSMVMDLNKDKTPLHDIIHFNKEIEAEDRRGNKYYYFIEVAMQYTDSDEVIEEHFVNTVANIQGGVHIDGFRLAIQRVVDGYFNNSSNPQQDLHWSELTRGLTVAIGIRHPDVQFQSPTKTHLMNPEIMGGVFELVSAHFHPTLTQELSQYFQSIYDSHFPDEADG